MKKVWFMLAVLMCILASCSDGGSETPVTPNQKPGTSSSEITIDPTILSSGLAFEASQGEKSITFSASSDWSLSIAETRSGTAWCTASPTSGGKGTASVKFTTTENTEPDDRSVAVTIKVGTASKTFTITQKGKDALLVTTKKYELPKEGGEIEIEVKANVEYQMAISETAKEWISEATGRALTTHKHILKIAPSEEAVKREGEITFKSGDMVETVKVYQAGEAVLLLSKNEFTVSDAGETISVDVKSNIEYSVQMPNVDWIKEQEASRAMSSHTLKYVVAANETYDNREAIIIFYDKNSEMKEILNIVQNQKNAIVLSKKEYEVKAEGEAIEVKLAANVDFEIKMPDVNWVSEKETRGLKEQIVCFVIEENDDEKEREADILFVNVNSQLTETLKITQKGKENIPYLTFKADATEKFRLSKAVNTLEYSVDGGEWTILGVSEITFGGTNGDLRLRGKSKIGTAVNYYDDYSEIYFKNNLKVSCSGDIRTLIDYENYEMVDTKEAKFCNLFRYTSIISAPELPATTLSNTCYMYMFEGCTKLEMAPELPAKILKTYCYAYMFSGCTSLKIAPELPATTIASKCYAYMFHDCTSLTSAPELPAMNMESTCYQNMFAGCTSLVKAPELPATTLADGCYNEMFTGCTSLAEAPEILPATVLKRVCYENMFSHCTSLQTAPILPAITLEYKCYANMFYGCEKLNYITMLAKRGYANGVFQWVEGVAPTGVFVRNPEASYGIAGWTIIDYTGELDI